MVLNFDSSRLVRETTTGNMIFLKIDERFEIPNQLKVLILENIPYVKVSKSINIPTTLNELIIRKYQELSLPTTLTLYYPTKLYIDLH